MDWWKRMTGNTALTVISTGFTYSPGSSRTTFTASGSNRLCQAGRDEFPVQTETATDQEGFHETRLARFVAYDLRFLLTSHRYYIYSEQVKSISPADLCHTLSIDDDTATGHTVCSCSAALTSTWLRSETERPNTDR